jgi:cation diffusion facilitator CzcD-associated flavoprotein CzcO
MKSTVDVAIVGSGPSGLSLAAHLGHKRVEYRIFGPPMQFWLNMPIGIALKSQDFATNVYTPRKGYTFIDYCAAHGLSVDEPIAMAQFAEYGLWAMKELVPSVEPAEVRRVAHTGTYSFEVELATGERVMARRVVIATGLSHFAHMPDELKGLPRELASHSSDHHHYKDFPNKEVVVLGRGASAVEAAALRCGIACFTRSRCSAQVA